MRVSATDRKLMIGGKSFCCAIGKNGAIDEKDKREGDCKTPIGEYPLRYVLYRGDRLSRDEMSFLEQFSKNTGLEVRGILKHYGWCDDPSHEDYNSLVELPHSDNASCESLWREDNLYDIVLVIGHNDSPAIAGRGSAIFVHVAKEDERGAYKPTKGCVSLCKADMLEMLRLCDRSEVISIEL